MAEQRTHNPLVGGSNPPGATKESRIYGFTLSGMSRLRSGQSTLDAWVRPFRRTTLQLRLRTQESAAALSPGTVPSTIRTSKDRKQLASPMRQPPILTVLINTQLQLGGSDYRSISTVLTVLAACRRK